MTTEPVAAVPAPGDPSVVAEGAAAMDVQPQPSVRRKRTAGSRTAAALMQRTSAWVAAAAAMFGGWQQGVASAAAGAGTSGGGQLGAGHFPLWGSGRGRERWYEPESGGGVDFFPPQQQEQPVGVEEGGGRDPMACDTPKSVPARSSGSDVTMEEEEGWQPGRSSSHGKPRAASVGASAPRRSGSRPRSRQAGTSRSMGLCSPGLTSTTAAGAAASGLSQPPPLAGWTGLPDPVPKRHKASPRSSFAPPVLPDMSSWRDPGSPASSWMTGSPGRSEHASSSEASAQHRWPTAPGLQLPAAAAAGGAGGSGGAATPGAAAAAGGGSNAFGPSSPLVSPLGAGPLPLFKPAAVAAEGAGTLAEVHPSAAVAVPAAGGDALGQHPGAGVAAGEDVVTDVQAAELILALSSARVFNTSQ